MQISTIDLDLAKRVFQVHGVDAAGELDTGGHDGVPELARTALKSMAKQLRAAEGRLAELDREIRAWHRTNADSRRSGPGF